MSVSQEGKRRVGSECAWKGLGSVPLLWKERRCSRRRQDCCVYLEGTEVKFNPMVFSFLFVKEGDKILTTCLLLDWVSYL